MTQTHAATDRNAYGNTGRFSIKSSLTDETYLKQLAHTDMLLRLADEKTLANLCLHYLKTPVGESAFALRESIRYFTQTCKRQDGSCKRLIGIAEDLVPEETVSLRLPYQLDD